MNWNPKKFEDNNNYKLKKFDLLLLHLTPLLIKVLNEDYPYFKVIK